MPSAFHAAQSNTADDELGKQQVHDDDGQNGDSHHHVNLAHIKLEEVCTAQLCDQDGQGLFVGAVQHQSGNEVVVPAGHEGENGLHCQSGLHNGQHDLVEGVELACTVDAGSLYDLHGKGSVQILLHEEEHGGRCNAGQDQRDKAVLQAHLGDELQKAQSGHLRGHGHDQQDNGERGLFEFEVIGVDAVGRQGREIHAERRRAGRDDQAVADAGDDRDVSIGQHVLEVGNERFARQQREAFLDLEVGAGGVDHQHIEEEQAQKADEHQHQITPCAACSQCCFFRLISRSVCHNHFPPFAAFLAAFSSLRWARVRPSSSLVREK